MMRSQTPPPTTIGRVHQRVAQLKMPIQNPDDDPGLTPSSSNRSSVDSAQSQPTFQRRKLVSFSRTLDDAASPSRPVVMHNGSGALRSILSGKYAFAVAQDLFLSSYKQALPERLVPTTPEIWRGLEVYFKQNQDLAKLFYASGFRWLYKGVKIGTATQTSLQFLKIFGTPQGLHIGLIIHLQSVVRKNTTQAAEELAFYKAVGIGKIQAAFCLSPAKQAEEYEGLREAINHILMIAGEIMFSKGKSVLITDDDPTRQPTVVLFVCWLLKQGWSLENALGQAEAHLREIPSLESHWMSFVYEYAKRIDTEGQQRLERVTRPSSRNQHR